MSDCEIKKASPISLSGISSDIKIIGVDYTVGGMDGPSEVSVSLIDKNDFLKDFELNLSSHYTILLGGITFEGVPKSISYSCSPNSGKITKISFVDKSYVLDKILVGLWGKHWPATKRSITVGKHKAESWSRNNFFGNSRMVVVGTFIDPCGDDELARVKDPCDPCEDNPLELIKEEEREMKEVDCNKARLLNILDVDYSFSELVQSIHGSGCGVQIQGAGSLAQLPYRASYSGTLRDVLSSWCKDFGWGFHWVNGVVRLFDLNNGININLKGLESSCEILSLEDSKSLDGTFSNVVIGSHSRQGEEKNFNCKYELGKRIACRPLNLKDLLAPQGNSRIALSYDLNYELTELMCMCSMYSPRLREAVAWLNVYGVTTAEAAGNRVSGGGSVTGIPGVTVPYTAYHSMDYLDDLELNKSSLELLDLTVKRVFSQKLNSTGFNAILNAVGGEIKEIFNDPDSDPDDFYFFIGNRNTEKFSNRYEWESTVGSGFLGRFFIRKFSSIHGRNPSVVGAGGDSVTYYENRAPGLDFSRFFIDPNTSSYINELADEENDETKDSFILVERTPIWLPPVAEGDDLETLINICDDVVPAEVTKVLSLNLGNNSNWSQGSLRNEHQGAPKENGGWTEFDTIFFVKKYKKSKNQGALLISNLTTYDFHPEERSSRIEADGYRVPVKVGLRSTQAKKIFIENIVFWTPPQSSVNEQNSSQDEGRANHIPFGGGYLTLMRNSASSETLLTVPKTEIVIPNLELAGSNSLKNILIHTDLQQEDIDDFVTKDKECLPNEEFIKNKINNFVAPLIISHSLPIREVSVEMNGLPSQEFGPEDGLTQFSVRVYDDAPVSNLTFSDSVPVTPDPRIANKIARDPKFYSIGSIRRWNSPSDEFPKESGIPTL